MPSIPCSSQNLPSQRRSQLMPNLEEFKKAILKSGIIFNINSDQPHFLVKEQALVVRDLTQYLESEESQDKIYNFLIGLKTYCKKEKHFKKFLSPTQFKSSNDSYTIIHQDSLFCLFLKVHLLQNDVVDILLEGVTAVAMEESDDTSWLRTLLRPLRCLPSIKNGEALAKKLLDILEISTFPCKLELLDAIPEIIPDSECDATAKQLTKLLDENDALSGAIVDCLNALNLEANTRAQVQDRILAKILAGTSLKIFPILLQFLMSDNKSQNLLPTLLKIRNALDNIMAGGSGKERESSKILIFHHLQKFVISQKPIAEAWLTTISNIKVHSDHKPVDLLIMFMLHHTSEIRKRVIEAIFRKRVSMGLFKISLLEKAFDKYITPQLLKDYMSSIIDIGSCLLRFAKDATVAKFATILFETLFNHIYTGAIYRGEVLSSLISLTGSNDLITINTVLKLMSSLVSIDYQKVQTHMPVLMQLLEKFDTLDLKDVKIAFDILCSLLCGEKANESLSGFKDEIYITVRKKLSCSERTAKHRGIVSAVIMAKHMASVESENEDENSPPKAARKLLELVESCAAGSPELLGLYYDQLASILVSEQYFDKVFLLWLYETTTEDFNRMFVTEVVPESTNDLNFSMQYVLNTIDETEVIFGINIAGHTNSNKNDEILLLAPFFRLLRLVHLRQHDGVLTEIDALIGCGVVLPEIDDPSDLDVEQIRQVADCLFHCANWFRETISAFVTQKAQEHKRKVVIRLQNLIEVERKLYSFLECVPEHNLPRSYFDSLMNISKQVPVKIDTKSRKNLKKRAKTSSIVNDVNDTTINTQKSTKSTTTSSSKKIFIQRYINFRELDTDIILLLKYPLKLNDDDGMRSTQSHTLNLGQVNFILKDFINKLTTLTQNKDIGLNHLSDVIPEHLIRDCVRILPFINEYLKVIVNQIDILIEKTDERHDLPDLFTEDAEEIKTCFGCILQIFLLIFQWPGFQHTANVDLLRNLLKSMRPESSQTLNSANRLIVEFIDRLGCLVKECLNLNHAVSLIKTMEVLHRATVHSNEIQKKIAITSQKLLSKRWYNSYGDLEHGKDCNQNINVLVQAYLSNANTKNLSEIVETAKAQVNSLESKQDCLQMLPAIDKQNFHVFYLGICNALLNRVKTETESLTHNQHLILWYTMGLTMTGLIGIVKDQQNRTNLSCFLKKSIGILKIFLTQGVPIMEIMLKSKCDQVLQIFKTIQTTTRFLHNLCCHSKITQDASLVAHVPSFRHTLESLIYRVKAALVANNCSAAFWMGNLKNKDLDGEDIRSQSTILSSTVEENDELPSDDGDDENIINNESANDDDTVESEVYF